MSETPEGGWPAQPDLTPRETFAQILRKDSVVLDHTANWLEVADVHRAAYRRADREAVRRRLAGVIAHCETLSLALK